MSTNTTRSYTRFGITIDTQALVMAVLFLLVTAATVELTMTMAAAGESIQTPINDMEPPGGIETPDSVDSAGAGAGWALLEVIFAVTLFGIIALYDRAPEWVQELIRWNLMLAVALYLGYKGAQTGRTLTYTIAYFAAILTGWKLIEEAGLWWLANNVLVIAIAILAGAGLGLLFEPIAIAVALCILLVYDHVFADRGTQMFQLLSVMLKARIPMLFVWPTTLRFDWTSAFGLANDPNTAADESDDAGDLDDEPDEIAWGIGMADLLIPAGFAGAVAVHAPLPLTDTRLLIVAGVVVGLLVACFRLRYKMEHAGSGAGLPAIAAGVLGGWLVALALTTLATTLGNTVVVG